MAGASQHRSVGRLSQGEDIEASQPLANLAPGHTRIGGNKDAAIGLVVDHTRVDSIGIGAIDKQRLHFAA